MNLLSNRLWTPRAIDALVAAVVAGYKDVSLRCDIRHTGAASIWKDLVDAESWQGIPPAGETEFRADRDYADVPEYTTEPGKALELLPVLLSWGYRAIIHTPATPDGPFRIDIVPAHGPTNAEPVASREDPMLEMGLAWAALDLAAQRDPERFHREVHRIAAMAASAQSANDRVLAGV